MKRFKIGFLALTALLTMSFTVAPNSNAFKKRVPVTNCYQTLNVGEWLQTCITATYQQINKSNYPAEVNEIVKNNLSVSNYVASPASVTCNGGTTFCCIQFTSAGASDPCFFGSNELRAPALIPLRDNSSLNITTNDYVKIVNVFLNLNYWHDANEQ